MRSSQEQVDMWTSAYIQLKQKKTQSIYNLETNCTLQKLMDKTTALHFMKQFQTKHGPFSKSFDYHPCLYLLECLTVFHQSSESADRAHLFFPPEGALTNLRAKKDCYYHQFQYPI